MSWHRGEKGTCVHVAQVRPLERFTTTHEPVELHWNTVHELLVDGLPVQLLPDAKLCRVQLPNPLH